MNVIIPVVVPINLPEGWPATAAGEPLHTRMAEAAKTAVLNAVGQAYANGLNTGDHFEFEIDTPYLGEVKTEP